MIYHGITGYIPANAPLSFSKIFEAVGIQNHLPSSVKEKFCNGKVNCDKTHASSARYCLRHGAAVGNAYSGGAYHIVLVHVELCTCYIHPLTKWPGILYHNPVDRYLTMLTLLVHLCQRSAGGFVGLGI